MRARSVVASIALVIAIVSGSARAHAQAGTQATAAESEAQAREAFQRGRIHYDNGEFDQAAVAFEQAYSLSRRHALLYNLYLAYRDANQQEKAAEALRNYLDRVEVIENRPQLEARLKALEEGIAARKAQETAATPATQLAEPVAQPAAPAANDAPEDEGNPRWWLTPVVLAGGGAALMLGGVATGVMASSKQKELDDKCVDGVCDQSLKSTADSGKTLAMVTDVLLIGGGALVVTGAVLFFVKKPKAREEPTSTAGVVCTPRLCGGSVAVRF